MSRPPRRAWLLLALAAALAAAVAVALLARPGSPSHPPRAPGTRIVSLAPSVTEILFLLGLKDSIVGVTDKCDFPPEAKRIERVGGFGTPNIERLLALHPDLVIASGLEKRDAADTLRASGIRVLAVQTRNFQELFEAIRRIAQGAGSPGRADPVLASMQANLESVTEAYRTVRAENRPRVYVEIWNDPIVTAGGGSFLDEIISRAGGVNVAHDLPQPFPRVSPEKVIQWNPDVILVAHMSRQAGQAGELAGRIGWNGISAVKKGRIIRDIPPDLLLRPGPRLVEGVKLLAQRLYATPTTEDTADSRGQDAPGTSFPGPGSENPGDPATRQ